MDSTLNMASEYQNMAKQIPINSAIKPNSSVLSLQLILLRVYPFLDKKLTVKILEDLPTEECTIDFHGCIL